MRIPFLLSIILSLLLFASTPLLLGAQEDEASPRAVLVDPVHDVGKVDYGTEVEHTFSIRNEGDAPLELLSADSTCACAVLDYDEKIDPGETGSVRVLVKTEAQSGAFAVSIEAVTNEMLNPTLTMTLKGELEYHVHAIPGYARYIVYQGFEEEGLIAQTLWSNDENDIRVTGVESSLEYLAASFREASEEERQPDVEAKQWRVETVLSPDAPIGPLGGTLRVEIDHPRQKVVMVPIHGFVRPIFAVTPPEADFGSFKVGEGGARKSYHVKSFANEEIEVTGAETTIPGIEAEVHQGSSARVHYVVVTVKPEIGQGSFDGTLRIRTASPKQPVIEVPLRGEVL